ncbi:MAG TPA: glucans biosynthesis glucosyltransferase MdoH [Opitutaceae bacterium]
MVFDPSRLSADECSRRRHRVVTIVILMVAPAVVTMADLHWRTGFDTWKVAHLVLFTLLLVLIALGATQSLIGYWLRRSGAETCRIADTLSAEDLGRPVTARTAVVMPIFNEEVARVIEGIRAVYTSVQKTGRLPECDFFILSDSNDPNCWIAEEAAWLALTRELGAHGRIFYRKRRMGINKKAGNIADFCRRWGRIYRYMVVLDADSIMTGDAILRLVQLMEKNRRVGIIQGVPMLANGETILARLQQFASRLYGPLSAAGLNYWQLGEANYWGHNAIIRLAPFMRHCSLPELPGSGAFGGRILSHDYVEAALMRRAGWEVWLATGIEGNYEECPPTVVDLAERDRRWLQGNLQHTRLIFARGFHPVNRVHFLLGILSYLASPLWLAFLVLSVVIAGHLHDADVASLPMRGFAAYARWSYAGEALCLFFYTLVLLFLPKALSLLDLRGRPADVEDFGGWEGLLASVSLETVIFTLLAPVLMLFHSWFIGLTLLGKRVSWGTQRRGGSDGAQWAEAARAHGAQTVLGILAAYVVFRVDVGLALWMSPILAGLILSIPLSYLTGSQPLGLTMQAQGLFDTPEETRPLPEIRELAERTAARRSAPQPPDKLRPNYGLLQAVLDPYVNAVHVSFLRAKDDPPQATGERLVALRAKLMQGGPQALQPRDRTSLLLDAESMHLLHRDVWASPASRLSEWWQAGLEYYTRLAPPPRTAFSR